MNNDIYLTPFLTAFFFSAILFFATVKLSEKTAFLKTRNRESGRHIHRQNLSRLGGVAIVLAFLLTLLVDDRLFFSKQLVGVFLVSLAIIFVGVFDDIWQLSWKKQLFFQISAALFVFLMGIRLEYVTNPFGGIFLFKNSLLGNSLSLLAVVFWILLIINAMNWVDGIDGVSGGISIIGALAIFFVSLRPQVNQPPVAIISAALVGSLLAFVIFNFNPAKILAGTSGSFFMGFSLAVLSIFAGAKIATTLLVLAIPVIDALWVILERLGSHDSIFSPDSRHLHYRLLKLGWSQRQICLFYWIITALIAGLALGVGPAGKLAVFLTVLAAMLFVYALVREKNKHPNI